MNKFLTLVFLIVPLLATNAWANDAKRRRFVEALGKVEAGTTEAEDYDSLRSYVLYPYLEAAELRRTLRRGAGDYTDGRVKKFLDRHGEAAFTRGLRLVWMRGLAERSQWQTLLDYYPTKANGEQQCLAAQAKTRLGRQDAQSAAEALWLSGGLRHKSCGPVFDWLEAKGHLTQALIDGRVRMAMAAGNLKLVQTLVRKQTGKYRKRTDHWIWAYRNPRDSTSALASSGDRQMDAEMLGQVFRRLVKADRNRAAKLYDRAMANSGADQTLKQQLAAFIGFRHVLNREPEALSWYRRSGTVELRDIESDWRIRSAIYAEAWDDVLKWIAALPEDKQANPRWQYWKGRALFAKGKATEGRTAYQQINGKRDFYGFLAADKLGTNYGIVDRPVAPDESKQQALKVRGDVQRAFELWKAGLNDQARAEWSVLLDELDKDMRQQAGVLADDWGWWSIAITSYGKANYWDDLSRRFPAPHRTIYQRETQRQGIPRAWAYGITRSESMFAHDARSPVGALGLMQLMPATAKQVSRKEGLRWRGTGMLYDEARNVRLGVRYLADLKSKLGHIALATAAYNAGPGNVQKWTPARTLPADIWIEAVPFGATHNYLRHVLEFTATYEWRLNGGKVTKLSSRLPPVKGR